MEEEKVIHKVELPVDMWEWSVGLLVVEYETNLDLIANSHEGDVNLIDYEYNRDISKESIQQIQKQVGIVWYNFE